MGLTLPKSQLSVDGNLLAHKKFQAVSELKKAHPNPQHLGDTDRIILEGMIILMDVFVWQYGKNQEYFPT